MNRQRQGREGERTKPGIGQILRSLGLDVAYHRAAGDLIYYVDEQGSEVEVLDLIGGYGTLLLGHNHPALTQEAVRFLSSGRPNHVQGSRRELAEQLAEELARRTGRDDCVVFANSGTEAVEAAIKHALLETGGRTFFALEGAFHGKTLGAVQLTANPAFREMFADAGCELDVVHIRPGDISQLEASFEHVERPAGFVFEPILGEGGVRPLSPEFVRRMIELCKARNVPAIADECQTGLGRTGTFLACDLLGVRPDYVVLSKALGGGLAKISALLIDRPRYRHDFDLRHTSTFADDDFSCAIACKTLELIDAPLIDRCRQLGDGLLDRLSQLRQKYPTVIADVRGAGLMLGIELQDQSSSPSFLLRQFSARRQLGAIVASYLLNTHRVRIAPTLSEPLTLRVQPSAFVSIECLDRFVGSFEETCSVLANQDVVQLTKQLSEQTVATSLRDAGQRVGPGTGSGVFFAAQALTQPTRKNGRKKDSRPLHVRPLHWKPASGAGVCVSERRDHGKAFAWLFHLIDAKDAPNLEPALKGRSVGELNTFLNRLAPRAEPIAMPPVEISSPVGITINLWPILLPVTSAWLKQQIDTRQIDAVTELLERAISVSESLGAGLVSLGQFTSIVSGNGRKLVNSRMGLTTGNSYTTALIVEAIQQAERERGVVSQASTLAVVGAAGNIGRACAEILAPHYRRVLLVGRDHPAAQQRLQGLAHRISHARISCELSCVRAADVVVCATSSVEPVLGPEHLRRDAIICDASVPQAVRTETEGMRPDVTLLRGGIVLLPNRERLDIPGLPLPPGYAFGCLAEGAILCFEGIRDASFTGRLCPERIAQIRELALRHGFELPASECRNLSSAGAIM